ncbi:MAG: glycosyltransferase family 4 protein [Comamonadaceae bacterium]|jgi:glycosyltransferase involved in cell wall biosynthesis
MTEPRRLRIAVLNRVFSPTGGGAERYSIALVEQLAQRHEIHVFAQQIDHCWPGVSYHLMSSPLTRPRWINLLWYAVTTWWATRRGFDIVHSHENTWHGHVQTVHVLPLKYNLFQGRSGLRRLLRYLKVASSPRLLAYLAMEHFRFVPTQRKAVVVTSPTLKSLVGQTYPASVTAMISPGVTLPLDAIDRYAARRELGLPEQGFLIAFVANDYQKKGLSSLLEALRCLPVEVELAVVGNPSQIEKFQRMASSTGLTGRVHFLGHLRDVTQLYRAADMLAHPTTEDTFAMVVLEAMAYGLPVVVSDARYCGIAGMLTHGVNAIILSSPTDTAQLSSVLAQVLADKSLREALASNAREFAQQRAWPSIAAEQEAMYFNLAERTS